MAKRQPRSPEQKRQTAAALTLLLAMLAVAIAVLSGLALTPRVKLVEVITVLASATGGGAGLVAAIVQFRDARRAGS